MENLETALLIFLGFALFCLIDTVWGITPRLTAWLSRDLES